MKRTRKRARKRTRKPTMKRARKPLKRKRTKNMIRMIEHYDENRVRRWGRLYKEHTGHIFVLNCYGDKIKVPRQDIIEERDVTIEYLKSIDIIGGWLKNINKRN